jgi:hypothetical protein
MSALQLSVKHGRSLQEARQLLQQAVEQVRGRFALLIHAIEWSDDRNAVKLSGTGFLVEMRVDAQDVHVRGDIPVLGPLLGGPLASGLKKVVRQTFQKRLT